MSTRSTTAALCLLALAGCYGDPDAVSLVGTVERTPIELVAPVSEVVRAVHVQRGEAVAPGRTLVELDATLARAEVAAADAARVGATTSTRVASADLQRLRNLRRERLATEQDVERGLLLLDEAGSRLREAEARLEAARKRESDLVLLAPAAGVIEQLPYDPGERVPAGGVVAVLLADAEPWVRVWVPQWEASRVRAGTRAEIRIDGLDGALRGSVLEVSREPGFTPHYALSERDRVHLVYEARVAIHDAPAGLRPGLPAEVELSLDGAPAQEAP